MDTRVCGSTEGLNNNRPPDEEWLKKMMSEQETLRANKSQNKSEKMRSDKKKKHGFERSCVQVRDEDHVLQD